MSLLIIGLLTLVVGVFCGVFLNGRFASRMKRSQAKTLPMFRAKPARPRSRRARAQQVKEAEAAQALNVRRSRSAHRRRLVVVLLVVLAVVGVAGVLVYNQIGSQAVAGIEIAVELPLTGQSSPSGTPPSEGIQLAVEEANANNQGPTIQLTTYDDQGNDELARGLANQIVASQALVVLGPAFSTTSLATGPTYATADMVSLPTNATSDQITTNATTFPVLFKNSDEGDLLANYLVRVLDQKRAAVFVLDTAYGQTLREGFERTATKLGVKATYYVFTDQTQASEMAKKVAQDPMPPPVVLLTLDKQGAQILVALRKLGVTGPFLGGDAFGKSSFTELVKNQPDERSKPGFFTDHLYGLTPVILDSADANVLAFAKRYRDRFGHDPDWAAVAGYDAATLAIAAVRATTSDAAASANLSAQRAAVGAYLHSLNSPEKALPGLLGPFWFGADRGRQQAIRVSRFNNGQLESAPIQVVSVSTPDPADITSGAVFELSPGHYARLQQVAYTGFFLNEVSRIDLARSSFTADFYFWLRFAHTVGPGGADPTNLRFRNLVSGTFDQNKPTRHEIMQDGTEYWLWHMQGEFQSNGDPWRFPFDHQSLSLAFSNASATPDQLIYVADSQGRTDETASLPATTGASATPVTQATAVASEAAFANVAPKAFLNLNEWKLLSINSGRDDLVADSTSGARNGPLALSGFAVTVELTRALSAFLTTVLPLLILSLIVCLALFLPTDRWREKIVVAIGVALCGFVPLTSINTQLGAVGSTTILGNSFYLFFGLVLLCIIATLGAVRLRVTGHGWAAARVEYGTRSIFILTLLVTAILTAVFMWK